MRDVVQFALIILRKGKALLHLLSLDSRRVKGSYGPIGLFLKRYPILFGFLLPEGFLQTFVRSNCNIFLFSKVLLFLGDGDQVLSQLCRFLEPFQGLDHCALPKGKQWIRVVDLSDIQGFHMAYLFLDLCR